MQRILGFYKKQQFIPRWYSVLINPFFIIRYHLYQQLAKMAVQFKGGKLLDFGCGSKPYRTLFDVKEYIGVDIENPGHPHLTEEVDVFYDGKTIPFEANTFDFLLCSEVMEHVFEPDAILKELNRVLKPGAKGIFTVPFVWNEHELPYDYGRYSAGGFTYLLNKNGFEVRDLVRTTHFTQVLSQLTLLYLYQLLETRNKYLNILVCMLFVSPLMLFFLLLTELLPKKSDLYHNLVVMVEKKP